MVLVQRVAVIMCVFGLLAPLGTAFILPYPYYYDPAARIDPSDGNWLEGYLTMQGGRGGISWDPAAQSDDPGGPAPDGAQDANHGASQAAAYYGGVRGAPIRVDTFTSAPIPRLLHLNASRNLQLDLQISGREDNQNRQYYDACSAYSNSRGVSYQPDPDLRIQVLLDGKLVAGAVVSQYIEWWWVGTGRPADPSPFSTCHYRMPLEAIEFPQGSVITLKVEVYSMSKGFQYGLAGDHRSVLRIPFFSDDDWLFRDPKAQVQAVGGAEAEAAANGELQPSLAAPFFGVAGLLLVPRRRRADAAILALALLAASAAGCLGGDEGAPEATRSGDVRATIDPGNGNSSGGGDNGSIAGQIHDDLHAPLAGVHVSLLGTSNFTRSDGYGRFSLKGLAPKEYEIRFDKEQYVSVQERVRVAKASVTKLDVTMVPSELKDSGRRNHKHDYWSGESTKTVMNAAIGTFCNGPSQCQPRTSFNVPPGEGGIMNSILPGTQEVIVTLTWDAAKMGYERVGLRVTAANDANTYNGSLFYPRRSGEAFRIATTWEMSDVGHQVGSAWSFSVYSDPADVSYARQWTNIATTYTDVSAPSFSAKVEIVKGAVPLEPGHPDLWNGNRVIPAVGNQVAYLYGNLYPPGVGYYETPAAYVGAEKVIPFDASWLEVNVTPTRDAVPPTDWVLWVKTGLSGYKDVWSYYGAPTPEFKKMGEPTKSGKKLVWKIPLGPGEADNPYTRRSAWIFAITAKDETAQWVDYWGPGWALKTIEFAVSAASHRDPM